MTADIPESLKRLLEVQYEPDICEKIISGFAERPATLRANTLKAPADETAAELRSCGVGLSPVEWSETAFVSSSDENALRQTEAYNGGRIYLQSLSSMIPPIVLDPSPGESILDMAAAPGGKTTQMAALSGGLADITACEKNKIRAQRLLYNLKKQGAGRVTVLETDARRLDSRFFFDKILLDAPCSGSGTVTPGRCNFSEELYIRSIRTQRELLKKALSLLKPGGKTVYSTCSVLKGENEEILNKVLPAAGAKILPIPEEAFKGAPRLPSDIPGTLLICPDSLYEGFFVALIEKMR